MGFLDTLAAYKQSDTTKLHDVLLNISSSENIVHVFFEGKTDESFYKMCLKKYIGGSKLITYKSGNKKSVYYFCENLHGRKNGKNIFIFFVDKDIDDLVPVIYPEYSCLFTTEYYSIESYLVSVEIFGAVVSELFKVGSGNKLYDKLIDQFSIDYSATLNLFLPLMAWILYHKRNRNRIIVQNLNITSYLTVDNELQIRMTEFDSLISEFDRITEVETDITDWDRNKEVLISELKKYDYKYFIRGKFEMAFFVKYCNVIREIIEAVNQAKVKCSFTLNADNMVDVLGPRLTVPECLDHFLEKNFV